MVAEIAFVANYWIHWTILISTSVGVLTSFLVATNSADAFFGIFLGLSLAVISGLFTSLMAEVTPTAAVFSELGVLLIGLAALAGMWWRGRSYE